MLNDAPKASLLCVFQYSLLVFVIQRYFEIIDKSSQFAFDVVDMLIDSLD